MSEADETHDPAPQQASALRASSRAKYASGAERLQMGDDALALLSFHGALVDGLCAYLVERGQTPGAWVGVLDALQSDPERPLGAQEAELLRENHQLRSRIAYGEDVAIDRSEVAAYQQAAWQLLRAYGVSVDQRQPRPVPEREAARSTEQGGAAEAAGSERPRRPRGIPPKDWSGWRDQALAQVQHNRRLVLPAAAGLVVFLLLCLTLRGLFGGDESPTASQATRPTIALTRPTSEATTPEPAGTTLADQQAAVLPTPGGAVPAPAAPAGQNPPVGVGQPTVGGLTVGGRAVVSTQGDPLNLRTQPSTGPSSTVITALVTGTSLQVLEGPTQAEGFTWWRVRAGQQEGWVVGDFLSAQAGP